MLCAVSGSLLQDSMVNSIKGVFISCDVPMAQFIAHLNNSLPASQKFIIRVLKLDTTCIFVKPHAEEMIRSAFINFRDQNSYAKAN
ncbi:RNA polymerase II transcription factor B subunit 5 isoform X1 [Arabidopsis lyrata subsp. lyrata]|nr:RNA polymerase II transcription factor B subunit 5 isoform X1 [Arabidopsis lyrata subsp. lyrata]|eukprot:XP_002888001.2 RNA polymerase II transcription factor B subunit 5 isoform X1 [Arabidopsis lyrata subsp. lyrata]